MAFNQELWTKDFAANLYDEKDFYRIGKNWSQYVLGAVTHIPQAVSDISPVKVTGATSYPVATQQVTYDELTFNNEMLAAPPRFVSNINASEASFDTRSAEMEDMVGYLRQAISMEIMDKWTPLATNSVIRTTGTATRENVYGQAAMKAITYQDVLDARSKLIRSSRNVDTSKMFLIVDPIMYSDIVAMGEFKQADVLTVQTVVNGFVGEIAGIKVIQRTLGNPITSLLAKPATLDYSDGYDATHFSAALLVDASKVGYALGTMENGEINMGFEPYATGYYNDVLQAHTRVGASTLYKEDAGNVIKGVVSIIETA